MARVFLLAVVCFVAHAVNINPNVQIRNVTDLYERETSDALLFHNGYLWAGRSRDFQGQNKYVLELFNEDGKLSDSYSLQHTNGAVWPFGENQVLVMGKNQWPWKCYFSIFTQQNGKIKLVSSRDFGIQIQPEFFAGNPSRMFFNEVGFAKVFEWAGGRPNYFTDKISGVGKMLLSGNFLYVIERGNVTLGDENLVRIDLTTKKHERAFNRYRNDLTNMINLHGGQRVAVSETLANQVLIMDPMTNGLVQTLQVDGQPEGLVEYKNCLVVISGVDNHMHFFKDVGGSYDKVDEWVVSQIGSRFRYGRYITVSPKTGRFFARSKIMTVNSSEPVNSILIAEDPTGLTEKACN